jgi:hypothetical protein
VGSESPAEASVVRASVAGSAVIFGALYLLSWTFYATVLEPFGLDPKDIGLDPPALAVRTFVLFLPGISAVVALRLLHHLLGRFGGWLGWHICLLLSIWWQIREFARIAKDVAPLDQKASAVTALTMMFLLCAAYLLANRWIDNKMRFRLAAVAFLALGTALVWTMFYAAELTGRVVYEEDTSVTIYSTLHYQILDFHPVWVHSVNTQLKTDLPSDPYCAYLLGVDGDIAQLWRTTQPFFGGGQLLRVHMGNVYLLDDQPRRGRQGCSEKEEDLKQIA